MYRRIIKFIEKAWRRLISDQSGSAIILALIIIAGLAGTGIGAARLARSNTQQTTLFEDSLKAFYASEAGVEAALLEWRFNHDVELWHKDNAKICAERVVAGLDTAICDQVIMTRAVTLNNEIGEGAEDITDQIYDENGQLLDDPAYPANQPWYELRMYFRDPYEPVRGSFADPADPAGNPIKIEKDETVEIRFPDDDVYNVLMKWRPTYDDYFNDKIRLLWSPVVTLGSDEVLYDDLDKYGDPNSSAAIQDRQYYSEYYNSALIGSDRKTFSISPAKYDTGMKVLRVTAQIDPLLSEFVDGDKKGVYLYIYTFNAGLIDMIHIPSNEVTIEVVGHYNNISRSVEYTLDRQSGTVMDIFDYGVFSKEDLTK